MALGVTPALAACSLGTSNFDAQTNQFYTPAEGVNERSAGVDVLNAVVVSDGSGTGRFIAGLVSNSTTTADALQEVKGSGDTAGITGTLKTPIDIAPSGFVQLADSGVEPVVLEGRQLVPGRFVELTITFEQAGTVTIQLPVVAAEDDFADVQLPSAEASP
jgi:hypothetical protein